MNRALRVPATAAELVPAFPDFVPRARASLAGHMLFGLVAAAVVGWLARGRPR
jgi:hypothetical protein